MNRQINYIYHLLGNVGLWWQLLFFVFPLCMILVLAFSGEQVLLYFKPFMSCSFLKIIGRSLVLALGNATACTVLAYALTYFLIFYTNKLRQLFLLLIILPFWVNFLLHIYAWIFVLDYQGCLNTILLKLGCIQSPLHVMNSMSATFLVMIYFYFPFTVLPLYTMLERFDKKLLDASYDLGATWWQTVKYVLLPLSMPGLRMAFLLVSIPSFGEFAIPEFMGGDKYMFVGSVVSDFLLGSGTMAHGAAFTIMSAIILSLVSVVVYKLMGRKQRILPLYE